MAEIKALLKEARKLIDEQNFKEAQECCKNILRKDKQNYFGLILLGKSLQDSEQAPLAYQKAISSKPDHPLAWQGLAHYYETKDDTSSKLKLLSIYKEILILQLEEDKALEFISKLGQLGLSLKNSDPIHILVNYVSKDLNTNLKEASVKQIFELLKADVPCDEEDIQSVLEILRSLYEREPNNALELTFAKVILQKSNIGSAVEEVIELSFFAKNVILREWVCKYLCRKFIEQDSFGALDIEKHVDKITQGIENSKYPDLLRSMISYAQESYVDAYKLCVPLINYQQADCTEATFIIRCTLKLKKWSVTQKLATNFLTKVKDESFAIELRKFLFFSLVKQQKWKQALSAVKYVPPETLNVSEQAMLAECYIEVNEPADHILKNIKTSEFYELLQSLLFLKQGKYNDIVKLIERSADSNVLNYFYLGRAYWELQQYDKCLLNLLKAAKLNPDHANTFLYLGHYYHQYKNDLEKARKCYEKAYSLNNIESDIAKNLSEIYVKLKLTDIDFEFLQNAEKSVQTHDTWISFRLGLHYMNRREWENAIVNLRNVIKNDNNHVTAFECLADAYYARGSFTSALRAYSKVMSLDPNKTLHCLTRTGNIYSQLTQHEDAITTFKKVLLMDSDSLLALKGIAETWMRVAKKKMTAKIYGTARDCAQYAIDYITKALSKQKQFSCFWKLLADSLMFITKLPNTYAYVYMKDTFNSSGEAIKIDKLDIFPQAIACYSLIAKQKQEIASYDLGAAYLAYYLENKKVVNCHISYNLTVACIKEKPNCWRYWNLLGKICIFLKKYELAQHCFIKALLGTRKWSVAKVWCNLGTLYLKLKLNKFANYCFWRGQSNMPSYPQSWIGQGLIAEVIREEEAMDLFRHASRLGYHPESGLGYADWVCRTLKNNKYKDDPETKYVIDGLYAIPYAIDLVEWFCSYEPNNACACTILGILQERYGLLGAAFKSYGKALKYAEEDKKNIALLNMARILFRMEQYDASIKAYQAITEASLNSASGLALALYKKGLYEESYAAYDTALHWLSNDDDEKADLLVAMAGIVYKYKGVDDAKTLLFHSIQISQKKPTAYSLFAICALGLIHSDQSLSKLALSELQKYEKDSNFGFDIGFLKSYSVVCEDNIELAIKLLSESLHDHPSNAFLWFCMSQYCLRVSDSKAHVASGCAQKALCSAKYSEYDLDSAKVIATASIAEHIAGNHGKALLLAKEGLHMYPHQAEIWAAVLLSLLSHKLWIDRKDWILGAAGYMRRHTNITRPLSRWVGLLEKKLVK